MFKCIKSRLKCKTQVLGTGKVEDKMKKAVVLISVLALICASLLSWKSFGDDQDPLISKSYLDLKLKELSAKIEKVEKIKAKQDDQNPAPTKASASFAPISFKAGDKVLFGEGAEFILRAGEAKIVDPTKTGLADLSEGTNLLDGEELPMNHLLLCPRADGRGLFCRTDAWVMVKGSYTKTDERAEELR